MPRDNRQQANHNPNPFYFVAFHKPDQPEEGYEPVEFPMVKSIAEWESPELFGECVTGFAEFELKALQPVHVAGEQQPGSIEGQMTGHSFFHRQGGVPVIPGSVIKGMLRSFIEALTCGHLVYANDDYPKVCGLDRNKQGRHIGFKLFKDDVNTHTKGGSKFERKMPPAAAEEVLLQDSRVAKDEVDLAHFLFGYVQGKHHHAGRLAFEDVHLSSADVSDEYSLVDLKKNALMGGPKPSASNWWYFHPDEIAKRVVTLPNGRVAEVVEPIGRKLRGRKFYFHQDAKRCVEWYMNRSNGWNTDRTPLYTYPAESLCPGKGGTFRLDFVHVPLGLLQLVLRSLDFGTNMKHKLGMGKAFGFGSCEFQLARVQARPSVSGFTPLRDISSSILPTIDHVVYSDEYDACFELLNPGILGELNTILEYDRDFVQQGPVFSYPPFGRGGFGVPASWQSNYGSGPRPATQEIVKEVYEQRPATSLEFYQKDARGWSTIDSRRIEDPYDDGEDS